MAPAAPAGPSRGPHSGPEGAPGAQTAPPGRPPPPVFPEFCGNVSVFGVLGPKMLTGISATATTTIVLDGFHLHQREFELVWDMADVILTAENLGLLPPEPQPANYETRITVGAIVSYYNFAAEATRTIKTPNGAVMISLENLLSGAD